MKKPKVIEYIDGPNGQPVAPKYSPKEQSELGAITSEVRYVANKMTVNRYAKGAISVQEKQRVEAHRKQLHKAVYRWYSTIELQNLIEFGIEKEGPERYITLLGLKPVQVLYLTNTQIGQLEQILESHSTAGFRLPSGSILLHESNLPIIRIEDAKRIRPKKKRQAVLEAWAVHESIHAHSGFQTMLRYDERPFSKTRRSGFSTTRVGAPTRKKTDENGDQYDEDEPDVYGKFFEEALARYHEFQYITTKLGTNSAFRKQLLDGKVPDLIAYKEMPQEPEDPYQYAGMALYLLEALNPRIPQLMLNVRKGQKGSLLAFRKEITKIAPGLYGELRKLQYDKNFLYDFAYGYEQIWKELKQKKKRKKAR